MLQGKFFSLQNSDQETALHCAAQHGHVDAVQVLLQHGADPNIKNCREETPLDLAALYGRCVCLSTGK
jgi:ankyrin repeat protein